MPKKSTALDEFSKELIKILPKNSFQKIFKQIENFDGETPETLLTKIKNTSINLPQISSEKQKSLQDNFKKAICSPEYTLQIKTSYNENSKFIKNLLEKDSRYTLLMNLINKADKNVEFVSLLILAPFSDLKRNFVVFCKPIKLLEEINNSAKEKRKNFLVELFREISEPLYYKYLEAVWRLSFLAENEIFPKETPKNFGNLVFQADHRLKKFPRLVEGKMKLLRNSFTHNNFEYNLENDSFMVWDDKISKSKMTADEIAKIANDVTNMCVETFPLVVYLYITRNFYVNSGFLDLQLKKMPALISENPTEVLKAENELSTFVELLTEPMRNFFQSHQ